jgi:hypothetical protein
VPTVLAVDVGTSHTVAVLRAGGRDRPLLFDGTPLLPSAVFAGPGGELYVGRDAVHASLTDPGRFEPNPKRRIDEGSVLLGDRPYPVPDLIAALLRRVAGEAVRTCGELPPVVLTHPAGWGPARRGVLTAAAGRAGLTVLGLVTEPVAAAAYFSSVLAHRLPAGGLVGVFDFGGGTLDVAVVRRTATSLEVIGTGGLDDLGGIDLDAALVAHLGTLLATHAPEAWQRLAPTTDAPDRVGALRDRASFWSGVRSAKEILARTTSAPVPVPGLPAGPHLTRDEFEAVAGPLLDRAVAATADVLRRCQLAPTALAGLFLVGGSSRIPLVARRLHTTLGIAPTVLEQPELAVAEGALNAITPDPTDPDPTGGAAAPAGHGEPADPAAPDDPGPAGLGGPGGETGVPSRRGRRRTVGVAIGVAVAVLAGAGTAAVLGGGLGGSGGGGHTGASQSASQQAGTASPSGSPMALAVARPSTLARNADLRTFLSGWDFYPGAWRCAKADAAHTLGVAGPVAGSADRGVPDEAIYCTQANLELYATHYRSGAGKDLARYVGAAQPENPPEGSDPTPPAGVTGEYVIHDWSDTRHAILWANGAQPATVLGVLTTAGNDDLQQIWYGYSAGSTHR